MADATAEASRVRALRPACGAYLHETVDQPPQLGVRAQVLRIVHLDRHAPILRGRILHPGTLRRPALPHCGGAVPYGLGDRSADALGP